MPLNLKIDIETLSPFKRKLLLIMPPLIIALFCLFNFILPAFEEIKILSSQVEKQKTDIALSEKQAARLTFLIAENERLKKRLLQLQEQLPEEKEVSQLLRQVSELAIKSGLDVIIWRPKERTIHPSKEVYEIPVDVEIRGSYHRFGEFFSNLTRLTRIVNLLSISMKPSEEKFQKKGSMLLHASFIAKTYSIISEQEKKELEKAEKEREKK